MRLGVVENDPDSIRKVLKKIMPVFIEFDRRFFRKKGKTINWEVATHIHYDPKKFLRMLMKDERLMMLGDYHFSRYIGIFKPQVTCRYDTDVAYIGDDASWLPFITPIVYRKFNDYQYFLDKYLEDYSAWLMLYIRGWRNRAIVRFYALGKRSRLFLKMAKQIFK